MPEMREVMPGEVFRNHRTRQADGLEVQATAIGRNDRDTHLRHDLQQTLVDGFAVTADSFGQRAIQEATFDTIGQRILGQIGVYSGRTTAHQNREVVRVNTFRRAYVQRCKCPQTFLDQPAVHSRGRKDHRHRHAVFALRLIGQNKVTSTRAHGLFRLGADVFQRNTQRAFIAACREGTVDLGHGRVECLGQLHELLVANKGAFQHDDFRLCATFIQHVLQVAETRLQRHHAVFTQTVDRWVRHLAEVLAEEVAERAVLVRQNSRRGVITHRGQRFFAVFSHRGQNLLQLFQRVTGSHLTATQFIALEQRLFFDLRQAFFHVVDLANPFPEAGPQPVCL